MPVTTRRMSDRQRQEVDHTYNGIEDRVSECVTMYPVFCTAKIPSDILDEFIDESYAGIRDTIGEGDLPGYGMSPCILQTTDLDSITHGSRKPMPVDFESPFLNWTDEQVREWATKASRPGHPSFAHRTFTILDQNTIDNKVCRVGYISVNEEDDDYRMLSEVFYADIMARVPLEEAEICWDETLLGVGADGVLDPTEEARKMVEDSRKKKGK
ncbi:hypothetical protein MGYG_01025 [Nannizzia gypsea CBS 118893]|uniref:Uncharacterized protein n=1 Tax=Arthroderma gypseum (strain ATCC MYA-4604 / CBS 118893) TaxID=535722 RepID=E5R3S9_ARTGP|nr:hypothetical protein MGYG_01025 [Nannizzia gypsea CBS 118893]EFQ97989.1 hypothetical protein MGYG_01025 [Nannizzia gypsea CBS 118893]